MATPPLDASEEKECRASAAARPIRGSNFKMKRCLAEELLDFRLFFAYTFWRCDPIPRYALGGIYGIERSAAS